MDASGVVEQVGYSVTKDGAEREEVEWLLTSGILGRSANLRRVLRYISDETFQGRAEQIKERTIAIEALGRRPDFEPQTDTIVRVTVRILRKRLVEVYQSDGADHPVQVILPLGSYAPSFVQRRRSTELETTDKGIDQIGNQGAEVPAFSLPSRRPSAALEIPEQAGLRTSSWFPVAVVVAILGVLLFFWWQHRTSSGAPKGSTANGSALQGLPPRKDTLHALIGSGRKPYVDRSGNAWVAADFCKGGSSVTAVEQKIQGTEDPTLYLGGQRGITHCIFPISDGRHEIHFHFAETQDLAPATSLATLSINAGPHIGVDIVDRAGGVGIATSMIVTDVQPESDGAIHLDFVSEVSALSAVEILPAPSANLLPVRIVAGSSPLIDDSGKTWISDRYFMGGRHGQTIKPETPGADIFASDRIGQFRYAIPVLDHHKYRVKLYFREPWFGRGTGGAGSRVFNVACNGKMLLENFDILAEAGTQPIVKSFEHVTATAGGILEISFTPVVNYPLVNAIEVIPED